MKHHHPHHHHTPHHAHRHMHHSRRRLGEVMVGKPDDTLAAFLADPSEYQWMLSRVINEGPPSKQVRNAMILKQLTELVKIVSAVTGRIPSPIQGIEIQSDDHESDDYTYPLELPEAILAGSRDRDEVVSLIEEGPAHDVLRDVLMMSVINWSKEAFRSKAVTI